jgi:NAD(P)-dependent dehydrogenase (short-subunit alcohol dehydrogenase family)
VDLGIRGKVALVTGGARSLGKADCLALAAEGCKVAILDLDPEGADLVAKQILADGGAARGYGCDIRDTGQVTEAMAAIERDIGPVDICVNNAGLIYTVGQLKDMRDEDWELNLAVNVTGTFKVTRAVFPGMRERRWLDGRLRPDGVRDVQDRSDRLREIGGARGSAPQRDMQRDRARHHRAQRVAVATLRADGQAGGDAEGGRAGGCGRRGDVPLLRAGALHHGCCAPRDGRDGSLYVLMQTRGSVERRSRACSGAMMARPSSAGAGRVRAR